MAAGDIASCLSTGDEATAALLDRIAGTVLTLGDNVYESGTADEYARCYAPSWGRHRARTRPSPGNHDYGTPRAAGYFAYFGANAGDPSRGYYSFDLGSWHLVALNSNCEAIGGCGRGSPQETWLREDLSKSTAKCSLAYWHHTLFSSGPHGSDPMMATLFQDLYDAGAEIVLTGHDHDYERFAPQSPSAQTDPSRGIRLFVVGTGGRSSYSLGPRIRNSEVSKTDIYGVLRLALASGSYEWEFVPAAGSTFVDRGTGTCH